MIPETILLITVLPAILFGGTWWARGRESKIWNDGKCAECGGKWKSFDVDSHGGRGYSCKSGHTIWISYNVDGQGMRFF